PGAGRFRQSFIVAQMRATRRACWRFADRLLCRRRIVSAVLKSVSAFVSPGFHKVLVMADHVFSSERPATATPGQPQPDLRSIVQVRLKLHACGPGRLNPWMGPSLRGLLAKPLKEHWCHWE